jgi:transcriptional regulator with XRE-family HTH domain
MTASELGYRVGRSPFSVARWEHGSTVPSADTLGKLAAALGVGMEDFFTT